MHHMFFTPTERRKVVFENKQLQPLYLVHISKRKTWWLDTVLLQPDTELYQQIICQHDGMLECRLIDKPRLRRQLTAYPAKVSCTIVDGEIVGFKCHFDGMQPLGITLPGTIKEWGEVIWVEQAWREFRFWQCQQSAA